MWQLPSVSVLDKSSSGKHGLEVKGNLNINPALGMTIVVPHQCIKVRSVGRVELRHGFTLVRTTTRQLKQPGVAAECVCAGAQVFTIKSWSMGPVPGLSYHLLAVLKLRAACDPSGARQREFRNQVQDSPWHTCRVIDPGCFSWAGLHAGVGG